MTHTCQPGEAIGCADSDPCTDDLCDEATGDCAHRLIDMDGDGQASTDLGMCGTDCDDTRADVFDGAEELCDGIDNNCNTDIDEVAPTWYVDCDGWVCGGHRLIAGRVRGAPGQCDGLWRRMGDAASCEPAEYRLRRYAGGHVPRVLLLSSPHTASGVGDDARFGNYNCNGAPRETMSCR